MGAQVTPRNVGNKELGHITRATATRTVLSANTWFSYPTDRSLIQDDAWTGPSEVTFKKTHGR